MGIKIVLKKIKISAQNFLFYRYFNTFSLEKFLKSIIFKSKNCLKITYLINFTKISISNH